MTFTVKLSQRPFCINYLDFCWKDISQEICNTIITRIAKTNDFDNLPSEALDFKVKKKNSSSHFDLQGNPKVAVFSSYTSCVCPASI